MALRWDRARTLELLAELREAGDVGLVGANALGEPVFAGPPEVLAQVRARFYEDLDD